MASGAFVLKTKVSEGEHLDEVWLAKTPWKGVPKRVIVP